MAIFGRRPGPTDIGFGEMLPGQARGAIMGRPSANGWVYALGGRVGKQPGSANVQYAHALYATANDNQLTTLMVGSAMGVAAAVMDYGGAGSNQTLKAQSPIKVYSRYSYGLVTRVASGYFAHGMDHSGHRLWSRSGAASGFPSPFGSAGGSPQGKPSFWAEFEPNVAPRTPSGLSPANTSTISSGRPTLGADFRDDNELLPGFTYGQADTVRSYRFEVWNAANTGRLRDSGVRSSSAAQRAARRVSWTVPTALPAGTYRARCTVWDQFDVPSQTATWVFTINAGGALTSVGLATASEIGEGVHATNTPNFGFTWTHAGGLTMGNGEFRLLNQAGSVIRGPHIYAGSYNWNLSPGQRAENAVWRNIVSVNEANGRWERLPPGTRYYLEVRGRDSEGLWTPWSRSPLLTLNAPPNVPTSLLPVPGTSVADYPVLSAAMTDANDPAHTLESGFYIRKQGATGNGVPVPGDRRWFANGRHHAQPDATGMPDLGVYEWRCRAADPWGAVGTYTAWQAITLTTLPEVTISSPQNGATLATGTPLIAWTVDRAMQVYEVRIFRNDDRSPVWSAADTISGTGGSVDVPAGILRNGVAYDVEVHIIATDGLGAGRRHTATVQYPQPAALANLMAGTTPGPLEPDADPGQWSRIALMWDAATVADVPDDEFAGYIVRRRNLTAGTVERIDGGMLAAREDTYFIDRTPTSGMAYAYEVTCLRLRNLVDTVESVTATVQQSVTLRHTVLCTIGPEDLGTPLRYWQDRSAKPEREWEVIPGFGPTPVTFQGALDHLVIRGTFQDIDDPFGTYTAQDVRRMVEDLGAPVTSDPAHPRGRVICYRDPLGRNALVVLRDTDPVDHNRSDLVEMDLEMIETNARQGHPMEELA